MGERAENVLLSGLIRSSAVRLPVRQGSSWARIGYSYLDSTNKLAIRHKATGTRLLVRSSRAKGAFGIVGARIAIADEPGSFDTIGGAMMADALDTAIGKPGTDLKVIYIGTVCAESIAGWWPQLVEDGSSGSTFVQSLQGDIRRWDQWSEIRRCNPLVEISASFRRTLLEERDAARRDPRLKGAILLIPIKSPIRR